jgi:hypothetical protein
MPPLETYVRFPRSQIADLKQSEKVPQMPAAELADVTTGTSGISRFAQVATPAEKAGRRRGRLNRSRVMVPRGQVFMPTRAWGGHPATRPTQPGYVSSRTIPYIGAAAHKKSPRPVRAPGSLIAMEMKMENTGLEPVTFWLPAKRSPN